MNVTKFVVEDGITSIGARSLFKCNTVTSVTMADSVTNIGQDAFSYCTNLTTVKFSKNLKTIGYMAFNSDTSLVTVVLPDSVEEIRDHAFGFCSNLAEINFPENLKTIGHTAFISCPKLTSVRIPKNTVIKAENFGLLYSNWLTYYSNETPTKVEGFTVYGYNGSDAQRYANEYSFNFVSLGDSLDDVPVTTDDDYIDENAYLFDALDVTNETFVSWGEFGEFTDLYLNGKKLRRGVDYYPSEGSSILEMLAKTLQNSFKAGTNTLSATFVDAGGDMHTSNQNIFVEKEQIGFGSGISEEYEEAFEASNYSGAAEAAREIASVQEIAGTPVQVQETTTENTNTGSAAKCAVSALLLLGAGAAFTCARRKREDGSDD